MENISILLAYSTRHSILALIKYFYYFLLCLQEGHFASSLFGSRPIWQLTLAQFNGKLSKLVTKLIGRNLHKVAETYKCRYNELSRNQLSITLRISYSFFSNESSGSEKKQNKMKMLTRCNCVHQIIFRSLFWIFSQFSTT